MSNDEIAPEPRERFLTADHDSRRSTLRALWVALATAVTFTAFGYVTAHVHSVRAGSPWQDDPYDVGVSFTLFLVPALVVLTAVRALLYRRGEPQPVYRAEQLLRAAGLSVLLVGATALLDWAAVALRADRARWDQGTPWMIAALALLTAGTVAAFVLLWHALRRLPAQGRRRPDGDWLGDLAVLALRLASHLPDTGVQLAARLLSDAVIDWIRRHVVALAAAASLAAGLAQSAAQAIGEGWTSPLLFVLSVGVAGGGYFAFCMCCNAVLRIAVPQATRADHGANSGPESAPGGGTSVVTKRGSRASKSRAVRHAAVAASFAMPVALALHGVLWPLVGQSGQVDSAAKAAAIVFTSAAAAGVVAFGTSFARS
ncbi:hypothetical protein [Streptacidiphilus fuscans]|uniref:Uncharacterized protein n=1 Tax=Streptacidiphilus fuscans TaxID=2789292 RepID=A0A931FF62_9ACTN|nr:hypothetical protein [Streptacidiphilus fuscans]MBF9069950.1 hypothetical protein [Streptacidiphilus fuscans]